MEASLHARVRVYVLVCACRITMHTCGHETAYVHAGVNTRANACVRTRSTTRSQVRTPMNFNNETSSLMYALICVHFPIITRYCIRPITWILRSIWNGKLFIKYIYIYIYASDLFSFPRDAASTRLGRVLCKVVSLANGGRVVDVLDLGWAMHHTAAEDEEVASDDYQWEMTRESTMFPVIGLVLTLPDQS